MLKKKLLVPTLASLLIISFAAGACSSIQSPITTVTAAPTVTPTTFSAAEATSPLSSAGVSYYFTQAGDHPEKALVSVIGEAKQTLNVAIYSLTLPAIADAILEAKNRGVMVRIISDKTEAKTKSQSAALGKLAAAGIPIKINTHSGLMHLKVSIIDGKIFTTGSFNYSEAASTTNDEVLLIDRDPAAAMKWDAQFNRMWNDTKGFTGFFLKNN